MNKYEIIYNANRSRVFARLLPRFGIWKEIEDGSNDMSSWVGSEGLCLRLLSIPRMFIQKRDFEFCKGKVQAGAQPGKMRV